MSPTYPRRWVLGGACAVLAATLFGQGCGSGESSEFVTPAAKAPTGSPLAGPGFDRSADAGGDGGGQDPLTSTCATASAEARRLPVYMQFVIDGSGSMDGVNSSGVGFVAGERETDPLMPSRQTGKKWIAVRDALAAFSDDLAAKNDPSFAVGLFLFSSTTTKNASTVDVPIEFVDAAHSAAMKARLAPPVFANGGTPLCGTIEGQLAVLQAYAPTAPVEPGGKYVLVAMTDGIPTDTKTACLASLTAARTGAPPVSTFAVGVGNEDADPVDVYDEVFMKDLALAGGTAVAGCNQSWGNADKTGTPCHFQITPGTKTASQIKADFLAAINAIRDAVASCEFPLTTPAGAGTIDPANVNVVMTSGAGTDTTIAQNGADGWTYDDPTSPTKVTLNGASCATLKADPAAKIKIVVGCKTLTEVTK